MEAKACPVSEDYKAMDCSLIAGNLTSVCQRFSGFEPDKTQFYHNWVKDNEKSCQPMPEFHNYSIYKM